MFRRIKPSRTGLYLWSGACLVVALGWLFAALGVDALASRPAASTEKVRPFVMKFNVTYYTSDAPQGVVVKTRLVERRSDGLRFERAFLGSTESPVRRLRDADGRAVHINESLKVRTTIPPSAETRKLIARKREHFRRRAAEGLELDCRQPLDFPAGRAVVAGVSTRVYEREAFGPDGVTLFRTSEYRAPSLGCVTVKTVLAARGVRGEYAKEWEDVAVEIKEVEPAGLNMAAVESYREVRPIEFYELTRGGGGAPTSEAARRSAPPAAIQRLERLYNAQQESSSEP